MQTIRKKKFTPDETKKSLNNTIKESAMYQKIIQNGNIRFVPLAPMYKPHDLTKYDGRNLTDDIDRFEIKEKQMHGMVTETRSGTNQAGAESIRIQREMADTRMKKDREVMELGATEMINTTHGYQNRVQGNDWGAASESDEEYESESDEEDNSPRDFIVVDFQPQVTHDITQIMTLWQAGLLDIKVGREMVARQLGVDPDLQKEFMVEKEDKEKEDKEKEEKEKRKNSGGGGNAKKKKKGNQKVVINIEAESDGD